MIGSRLLFDENKSMKLEMYEADLLTGGNYTSLRNYNQAILNDKNVENFCALCSILPKICFLQ